MLYSHQSITVFLYSMTRLINEENSFSVVS